MNTMLSVWVEGVLLGSLSAEKGVWKFQYDAGWLAHSGRFPLAPAFPLRAGVFEDKAEERPVQWFFDNLLPEGGVRQALARYAGLSERDSFGLLARFGEESAGALTLLPKGSSFPAEDGYAPLSTGELRQYIRDQPEIPLIAAHGKAKMSLAGAQHKLGVRWNGRDFFLPRGGAASSHILKPENARPEHFPFCPANEHFCMTLARTLGLPAPVTTLLHLPEPIYLVARYDRSIDGEHIGRRHQIDLCQLLGKWPGYKYEAEGGATFREAYGAQERVRQPAVARERLLRWLVFNYLIGNSDAHAKNVSFLVAADGIDLAPFYDLLCVKVYGDETMAMAIGDETRFGWVTGSAWDALAESVGIRASLLRRLSTELARSIPPAAKRILTRPEFSDAERQFLGKVVSIIDEHAGFVAEGGPSRRQV
jgi:serine/threonine-protein kinase HipA